MPNIRTNFDSLTSIVDHPAIAYPSVAGISNGSGNVDPDAGSPYFIIPIRLTSYTGPVRKQNPAPVDVMPIINPVNGGFAIGGKIMSYGSQELPKIQLEGFVDTPSVESVVNGEKLFLPNVFFNGMRVTFGDIMAAYMEGRAKLNTVAVGGGVTLENMWQRVNPVWFRDHAGRVYNDPTVVMFQGSFVEQFPGRVQFQMTLQVKPYA